jgi:hypothetical protein
MSLHVPHAVDPTGSTGPSNMLSCMEGPKAKSLRMRQRLQQRSQFVGWPRPLLDVSCGCIRGSETAAGRC